MTDLAAIIRRLSQPLLPKPTEAEPRTPALDGIRAVVFDVYGTLLISGSGDISLTSGAARGDAASEALEVVGRNAVDGDATVETLHQSIQQAHEQSAFEFPEVDIVSIWQTTLNTLFDGKATPAVEEARRLAVEYECRVNPIWPMPGLEELLQSIHAAGLRMGIVSNAQFFTPLAFDALLCKPIDALGFDPQLCEWSYAHLQAKPGRFMYDCLAKKVADQSIAPSEVLYVGNDMLNDIWPAAEVGFRTALFAGDARSLRLREGDPRVAEVRPDAVVTDLRQILSILTLVGG